MTMFARIIADSVSNLGIRLTTFHVRYWRAIHSEIMTHRDFGRNARSSRAVPSRVLLTEPIFVPQFGMNKAGMQSDILASPELQLKWALEWSELAEICRDFVRRWSEEGMHKQHANRPLEWFGWIDVQITSVYWENFWALRISEYAQPEFNELATAMRAAMMLSTPTVLMPGQWHLPWILDVELRQYPLDTLQKLSVARSARLSYEPFDGEPSVEKEIKRYEGLVVNRPVHASPAEHQATPDVWKPSRSFVNAGWEHPEQHGNLLGWRQYRKGIPHENVRETWALT